MNALSIDIGGTQIKVAVINKQGNFLEQSSFPTQNYKELSDFINFIRIESENALKKHHIAGVGIGCPNFNTSNGFIETPPNLPWGTLPIRKMLSDSLSIPCFIEKDAPLAALGEYYFGNYDLNSNLAVVTMGTGIGSGFIINGELFHGSNGMGSEAGHLIVGSNQRPCGCGGFDHLEAYSSVTALRSIASEVFQKKVSFTELKDLYLADNELALKIIHEAAKYLAFGITNLVNVLGISQIVLAGGGTSLGENFLNKVNIYYKEICFRPFENVSITYSRLPINHGALLGAAALVFNAKKPTLSLK